MSAWKSSATDPSLISETDRRSLEDIFAGAGTTHQHNQTVTGRLAERHGCRSARPAAQSCGCAATLSRATGNRRDAWLKPCRRRPPSRRRFRRRPSSADADSPAAGVAGYSDANWPPPPRMSRGELRMLPRSAPIQERREENDGLQPRTRARGPLADIAAPMGGPAVTALHPSNPNSNT